MTDETLPEWTAPIAPGMIRFAPDAPDEHQIRADERERIAALLVDNKDTFVEFAKDKPALVSLIALSLRLA